MTIAWVQGILGTDADGLAHATAEADSLQAVASGNFVAGYVGFNIGVNTLSILTSVTTDTGDTCTIIERLSDPGNTGRQSGATFYLANVTSGAKKFIANFSPNASEGRVVWDEFSGVAATSPLDNSGAAHSINAQDATDTGTDALTSGTFTTTTDGCLIYSGTQWSSTGAPLTIAHGTNFSLLEQGDFVNDNVPLASEYRIQATAAAGTAGTWTITGVAGMTTGAAAFKPAAGAAGDNFLGQICL